jgi:hypothetical protein
MSSMKSEDWMVGLNLAAAKMLIDEVNRKRGRPETDPAWLLGLDFLRLATMLDEAPGDALLIRAYRLIGSELREGHTEDWDPEVTALMERIRKGPGPRREW